MKYTKRRRKVDGSMPSDHTVGSGLTLHEALEVFLLSHDARGHSKNTSIHYRGPLRKLLNYLSTNYHYKTIDQVEEVAVLGWLAHIRSVNNSWGKPYSSRSVQAFTRCVIAFFHWLVQHDHLQVNPIAQLKEPKATKTLIRVFTDDELKRMDVACERTGANHNGYSPDERKALAARDRAILWFLLSTGVRVSELCGVLFSDIDWDTGMVYIRGKGAKERHIPFGKVAKQHLNTYIKYWRGMPAEDGDEHVFLNVFGGSISVGAVWDMFARLKIVADIPDKRVSPHTCRHWFAVNCIKQGLPTIALKGFLGHETWEMIEVYVHLAEQDNVTLYAQHSPVDNLSMHHSVKTRREQMREWRKAARGGKQSKK
ncbi:tyrosine recombinase XerD [Dictyobacter vulcani]|uniref:Tyrosine recombinase XerD n=1 Tax=Dictyobacter vulcani TaxID=2607529 RepID=A0A5J4KM20_9CHLR|nr:tyrosine-type recombinase/integrase [Dictyobacter vulcani]GER86186.1 tyrosine recombinase XerD [Dictyobacter vulcani]